MVKQVFISYKSEERETAEWLKAVLEENGISCWMDDLLTKGGNYADEIVKALNVVDMMVILLSSRSQSSDHVLSELLIASSLNKPALAYIIEDCELVDDFKDELPDERRFEAYKNKEEAANELVLTILSLLPTSSPKKQLSGILKDLLVLSQAQMDIDREKNAEKRRLKAEQRRIKREENARKRKERNEQYLKNGFPFKFTPYSKDYSSVGNARLSLNVYTCIILADLHLLLVFVIGQTGMLGTGILFLPFLLLMFWLGEAVAGVLCRLVGRIGSRKAVVAVSLITSVIITAVIFAAAFILIFGLILLFMRRMGVYW